VSALKFGLPTLLLVGASAIAVSGCGAEGSSNVPSAPVTTSSLGKAQYLERAKALCARNRKKREAATAAYGEKHENRPVAQRLEGAFQDVVVPSMEAHLAELRELGAPRGDEDAVEAIIVANEDWIDAVKQKGILAQGAVNRLFNRAAKLAIEYGLRACAFS
jgi:hypothetical protein